MACFFHNISFANPNWRRLRSLVGGFHDAGLCVRSERQSGPIRHWL